MPTIETLFERPLCNAPGGCPNPVEIKEVTPQGRYRVRNVCSWHRRHKTLEIPDPAGAGVPNTGQSPFSPVQCAFPGCSQPRSTIEGEIGKWCAKHRSKRIRDLERSHRPHLRHVTGSADTPVIQPRHQNDTNPHKPKKYPPSPDVAVQHSIKARVQRMADWRHGPSVALNRAIIDDTFPAGRVVMNDDGFVAWVTMSMVAAMDITVQHGWTSYDACRRAMQRVCPDKYWLKVSKRIGDTTPHITSALVYLLQSWLVDRRQRKKLGLKPLPKVVKKVSYAEAEKEAERMLELYK